MKAKSVQRNWGRAYPLAASAYTAHVIERWHASCRRYLAGDCRAQFGTGAAGTLHFEPGGVFFWMGLDPLTASRECPAVPLPTVVSAGFVGGAIPAVPNWYDCAEPFPARSLTAISLTLPASPPIRTGAPVDHSRPGDTSVLKSRIDQTDRDRGHIAARIDRDFVSDGVAVIGRGACIRRCRTNTKPEYRNGQQYKRGFLHMRFSS